MLDRRRFAALSSAWALAPTLARAQAPAYPTRFVRLVVPFPPGGGTDAIARVVSAKLSAIWGQQMVVENKGGGATSIGTDTVAKADPDGYTVLLQSVPPPGGNGTIRRTKRVGYAACAPADTGTAAAHTDAPNSSMTRRRSIGFALIR